MSFSKFPCSFNPFLQSLISIKEFFPYVFCNGPTSTKIHIHIKLFFLHSSFKEFKRLIFKIIFFYIFVYFCFRPLLAYYSLSIIKGGSSKFQLKVNCLCFITNQL